MMTSEVFGDRSQFAIEIFYDLGESGPTVVVGYFSYWIAGRQIGDGGYLHLTAQFGNMGWTRRDCGHRDGGKLCELTPSQIQRWWRMKIYEEPLEEFSDAGLPEDFARFSIMFNYGVPPQPILLIACEGRGRLIWVFDEILPPICLEDDIERFEGPIKDAYAFMDSLHDRVGFVDPS
jgi:hypothetical protein